MQHGWEFGKNEPVRQKKELREMLDEALKPPTIPSNKPTAPGFYTTLFMCVVWDCCRWQENGDICGDGCWGMVELMSSIWRVSHVWKGLGHLLKYAFCGGTFSERDRYILLNKLVFYMFVSWALRLHNGLTISCGRNSVPARSWERGPKSTLP